MLPISAATSPFRPVDDVIAGVKDILAERFAYDETARTMVREFAYDDGFFEVQLKNKKDPEFSRLDGKSIPIKEMTKQDPLILLCAEDKKAIRLKLEVQLFRIGELLKHHFITNPDFAGFDLLCQAIDDCWLRLLQPIVERDVKCACVKNLKTGRTPKFQGHSPQNYNQTKVKVLFFRSECSTIKISRLWHLTPMAVYWAHRWKKNIRPINPRSANALNSFIPATSPRSLLFPMMMSESSWKKVSGYQLTQEEQPLKLRGVKSPKQRLISQRRTG